MIAVTTNNHERSSTSAEGLKLEMNFTRIIRGGITAIVVLGFTYLMMLNSLATRGFDLEFLKADKLQLQKEIESLDIALAIPTSLYALESDERVQLMADIDKKVYLEVNDGGVAFLDAR